MFTIFQPLIFEQIFKFFENTHSFYNGLCIGIFIKKDNLTIEKCLNV